MLLQDFSRKSKMVENDTFMNYPVDQTKFWMYIAIPKFCDFWKEWLRRVVGVHEVVYRINAFYFKQNIANNSILRISLHSSLNLLDSM